VKHRISALLPALIIFMFLTSACGIALPGLTRQATPITSGTDTGQIEPLTKQTPTTITPSLQGLWISTSLPGLFLSAISKTDYPQAVDESTAALVLKQIASGESSQNLIHESDWIFALAAPFFTVRDGVTSEQLLQIWRGEASDELSTRQLEMEDSTFAAFTIMWGDPSPATVKIKPAGELLADTWAAENVWALIPFESIAPKYKILKIDGLSPLDKPLDIDKYLLRVKYGLFSNGNLDEATNTGVKAFTAQLPVTNRDESRMTVLIMSGTTAMTRATAFKIETKGMDYVTSGVRDWFLAADLRHVSNEISFDPDCPKPDPNSTSMRFCADPSYIQILKDLGINVVELTGNHENDYGPEHFAQTIATYNELGWTIFGGGLTPEDARKPALIENNGNKIAFIGCNPVGPSGDWVTDTHAGAAKCDPDYYYAQISALKQQGYVVIATFQHQEIYQYMYGDYLKADFRQAAASGADIVSGAQAHFPMGFEFNNNALIHYGMGNFLFDQMDYPVVGTRREFIDRHIIYGGSYINTELLTALLTDYSRPRPMTEEERTQFLTDLFTASQ